MKPRSVPYRERRKIVLLRNQAIMNDKKRKKTLNIVEEKEDTEVIKTKESSNEPTIVEEMDIIIAIEDIEENKEDTGQESHEAETPIERSEAVNNKKEQKQKSNGNLGEQNMQRTKHTDTDGNEEVNKVDKQHGNTRKRSSKEVQTEEVLESCQLCPQLQIRQSELINENVREQTARLKAESNFDVKNKRYAKALKDLTNLQKEIKTLS